MKNLDLGKSNINKIFWVYVIPTIFSFIFSTTAQFIDSAFIGKFVGEEGLAAITFISPFLMILNGVSIMIAIGGVTYAGIARGRKEDEKSNNFFNLTMLMIVVTAVISTIIFLVINNYFHLLFNLDSNVLALIKTYGFWISLGIIFSMSNLTFGLFLNLDKKPTLVVLISSLSTLLNVGLNYLLIVHLGLGIKGAAIASSISYVIPFFIYIVLIIKRSTWHFKLPKIKFSDIKNILYNGSSELINTSSVSIAGLILNKVILDSAGVQGVAAFSVALRLSDLVIGFGFGISDAIQSPVSFNYGATHYQRVKGILFKGLRLSVVFGLILGILTYLFGDSFSSFFINNKDTIEYSHHILKYYSFAFILMGGNVIISTYYTSVDSPLLSCIISVLKSLIYIVIWLLILPPIYGTNGIWLSLVLAEVSSSITAILIYNKYPFGDKIKKQLLKEKALA